MTWKPIYYLYAAIPVLIVSAIFTVTLPLAISRIQKALYPLESLRFHLQPRNFTMLGDELPTSVDVPGSNKTRAKAKAQRPGGLDRSRSRIREKFDGD